MKIGIDLSGLSKGEPGEAPESYLRKLIHKFREFREVEPYLIHHPLKDDQIPFQTDPFNEIIVPRSFLKGKYLNKHNLDLVHFNSLGKRLDYPFLKHKAVVTQHGDIYWCNPSLYDYGSKWKIPYLRFKDFIAGRKVTRLIVQTENFKKRLIENLKIPEDIIRYVPLGIDHETFHPIPECKERIREKYDIKGEYILHVSNYSVRKNPSTIVKTFEVLAKKECIDLVICGQRWNEKIIQKYMTDRIEKRIHILGYVPLKDLVDLYGASEVFFFPSFHENFGFPVVEAMACGTPVVTSNVYAMPEVVGDAGILCNPRKINQFVESITKILNDPGLKEELIKKGKKRAKDFSWKKCAEKTIQVYKKVLREDFSHKFGT